MGFHLRRSLLQEHGVEDPKRNYQFATKGFSLSSFPLLAVTTLHDCNRLDTDDSATDQLSCELYHHRLQLKFRCNLQIRRTLFQQIITKGIQRNSILPRLRINMLLSIPLCPRHDVDLYCFTRNRKGFRNFSLLMGRIVLYPLFNRNHSMEYVDLSTLSPRPVS